MNSYLDDPLAKELSASIPSRDPAAMDRFFKADKFVGYWAPAEAHHLADAHRNLIVDKLLIGIRTFDLCEATLEVSREPKRYFHIPAVHEKLRFLAIDAVGGKSHELSFQEEIGRCTMMRWIPPWPDPFMAPQAE